MRSSSNSTSVAFTDRTKDKDVSKIKKERGKERRRERKESGERETERERRREGKIEGREKVEGEGRERGERERGRRVREREKERRREKEGGREERDVLEASANRWLNSTLLCTASSSTTTGTSGLGSTVMSSPSGILIGWCISKSHDWERLERREGGRVALLHVVCNRNSKMKKGEKKYTVT